MRQLSGAKPDCAVQSSRAIASTKNNSSTAPSFYYPEHPIVDTCLGTVRGCPCPLAGRSLRASLPSAHSEVPALSPSGLRWPPTPARWTRATPHGLNHQKRQLQRAPGSKSERWRSAARDLTRTTPPDLIASPLHRVVRKAILAVVNLIVGTTPLQRPQVSHALAWLANRQPSRKVQLLSCPIASAP